MSTAFIWNDITVSLQSRRVEVDNVAFIWNDITVSLQSMRVEVDVIFSILFWNINMQTF
jgi:hypothetical protein